MIPFEVKTLRMLLANIVDCIRKDHIFTNANAACECTQSNSSKCKNFFLRTLTLSFMYAYTLTYFLNEKSLVASLKPQFDTVSLLLSDKISIK